MLLSNIIVSYQILTVTEIIDIYIFQYLRLAHPPAESLDFCLPQVHCGHCQPFEIVSQLFISVYIEVSCVVAVDSVCSDFKTARLLLSHYGFLNLEGLKVINLYFVSFRFLQGRQVDNC